MTLDQLIAVIVCFPRYLHHARPIMNIGRRRSPGSRQACSLRVEYQIHAHPLSGYLVSPQIVRLGPKKGKIALDAFSTGSRRWLREPAAALRLGTLEIKESPFEPQHSGRW